MDDDALKIEGEEGSLLGMLAVMAKAANLMTEWAPDKFEKLRDAPVIQPVASPRMLGRPISSHIVSWEVSHDRKVGLLGLRGCITTYWERQEWRERERSCWLRSKGTGVAALPDRRYRR
jgi:hypothetical protein